MDNTTSLSLDDAVTLPGSSVTMPRLGFGVYQIPGELCVESCLAALDLGYRHIDSAQLYRNEAQVGEALRQSKVGRGDVFVTTKVGQARGDPEATYANVLDSVRKIGGEDGYVDLFLVHTPRFGAQVRKELWLALERLQAEGRARSIGVSNYAIEHLEEMREYATTWPPQVNQIEVGKMHPPSPPPIHPPQNMTRGLIPARDPSG
jgi:diketogulonate reductase-like aldo/keto reductase